MNANLAVPLLARLKEFSGVYEGEGVNHEGETFRGTFSLGLELDDTLAKISFSAQDADNAFHREQTWIAEDLLAGGMGLWTVSTNTPGVLKLSLIEESADGSYLAKATFRLGEPSDLTRFREQIVIGLRHDRAIEYVYSWGVPHQKFDVRSKCLLKRMASGHFIGHEGAVIGPR